MKLLILFIAFFCFLQRPIAWATPAVDSILKIQTFNRTIQYKRSVLLSRPEIKKITVQEDPAYSERKMIYTAIPVYTLFKELNISKNSTIVFHCTDGFSAPISQVRLLNEDPSKSIAYLAMESENEKWPPISPPQNLQTPAPFYIIWVNPEKSKIGREEWPFQVTRFEVKKSLQEVYPNLYPSDTNSKKLETKRGLNVFIKYCFTCHTLNHEGEGKMGPDLNIPMNPTEYFSDLVLKKLIRNPQSLRTWPTSKMKGFNEKELSDAEISDLLIYLHEISKIKN